MTTVMTAVVPLAASRSAKAAPGPPELAAEPERHVDATIGGEASCFSIASVILGETRRVNIVLPPSFARSSATRRYPVLILTDGEFDLAPAAAAHDQLCRHGLIPECIMVGIENNDPYQG